LVNAKFDFSIFEMPAYFDRSWFHGATFNACFVEEQLEFDQAEMSRVNLLQAPLEKMHFTDCTWLKPKGINSIYDAYYGVGEFTTIKVGRNWPTSYRDGPASGKLEALFRTLKKKAREVHAEGLAGDWHYWEKEFQRLGCREKLSGIKLGNKSWWASLGMYLLLSIYKGICGYGETPGRALFVLLGLFLLPILGHYVLGIPQEPEAYIPLVKQTSSSLPGFWIEIGQGAYRIMLTLQAALLGLAIRNKMRR
jgi:hypothetical protein